MHLGTIPHHSRTPQMHWMPRSLGVTSENEGRKPETTLGSSVVPATQPRRMDSFWFGGVPVFVCVELAAAELLSGQRSALRTENTAGGRFMAR
jgi:hypothetical protein